MIDVLTKYPHLKKFVSHSETKDTTDMKKEKKREKDNNKEWNIDLFKTREIIWLSNVVL